jgi:hypothetical protein
MSRGRVRVALVTLALASFACGGEPEPSGPPVAIHGAIVIEPSELVVGDLVTVDLVVVTPPDHRVRPIDVSESSDALWLLDAETLPVRRTGERWAHVTRVRARVKALPGEYVWPDQAVEVEGPDGDVETLTLEAHPFTVSSVAASMPDRREPFGLRAPDRETGGLGRLGAALLGSVATLLVLGAGALARRARAARRAHAEAEPADATPAWVAADAELTAALAQVEGEPDAAADRAALALRRYVHRRARRPLETRTTEEIAAQRPPGRLRSRWPELVELLRRLDALRFPGDLAREGGRAALRDTLDDARRFVSDSIPPRELQ